MEVFILIAARTVSIAYESVLPLFRTTNGCQCLRLLFVLPLQPVNLVLQVFVSLEHVPQHHITATALLLLFVGGGRAVYAWGIGLFVPFDLLLEPHVFLNKFLVPSLAFLEVVEFGSSAHFVFGLIVGIF